MGDLSHLDLLRSLGDPEAAAAVDGLEHILDAERFPDLYGDVYHKVRINYYPPRCDNKEGWDNIDLFGWLGYPMQLKVDFLCRDSILAAPLALDLVLFSDLAQRAGLVGIQEWLSFYYKAPMVAPGLLPRARPLHPAHQAEEHPALDGGRGTDHPPRPRVLRRRLTPAKRVGAQRDRAARRPPDSLRAAISLSRRR